MSEQKASGTTNVIGYFNQNKHNVSIEISEINLKVELAPNTYIQDRNGRFINDPIFEKYCHAKGLSRATSKVPVPYHMVPRFKPAERPAAAVTQATSFVRQPDGRTIPVFAPQPLVRAASVANKSPHTGMSMEAARRLGLVGKPRLVSEDYGADESSSARSAVNPPPMKISLESPPKITLTGQLPAELTEADADLSPEERQNRTAIQHTLAQSAKKGTPEGYDPRAKIVNRPPVPLIAPSVPTMGAALTPISAPVSAAKKKTVSRKRVAIPVQEMPPPQPEPAHTIEPLAETEQSPKAASEEPTTDVLTEAEELLPTPPRPIGVIGPADDSGDEESPLRDATHEGSGQRFICAADGKTFGFRSELVRHIKRNYPQMMEALLERYPEQ